MKAISAVALFASTAASIASTVLLAINGHRNCKERRDKQKYKLPEQNVDTHFFSQRQSM